MKSEETYRLEEIITLATWNNGLIGCSEVGLGDSGIVDYVSIELSKARTVRCYELKISKSDFLSDAKKTFVGEFNFYVIPSRLWLDVKNYIEPGIGCWCIDDDGCAHKKRPAKRKKCKISKGYVTTRILLALEREHMKYVERDWQERQLSKGVSDYVGAGISVGDAVRWNNHEWTVTNISRQRVDTVLTPICTLSPNGWSGDDEDVKPASLRRI